jgi:STE24 endopeptidase
MMVNWAGIHFYIHCGNFVIVFLFIFVMIYPNLIMPLFNSFLNLDENNS